MRYYFLKKVKALVESALSIKGQATIPKAVREHLRLKPGDRVKFFVHSDGTVVLLPKLPLSSLRGIVKSRRSRPASIEEMDKAIAARAATGVRRGKLK
jgi:antitoxin PrlF